MKKQLVGAALAFATHLPSLVLAGSQQLKKEDTMQTQQTKKTSSLQEEAIPGVLYKITSVENWDASQGKSHLILAPMDDAFIHFSKADQLAQVLAKYWPDAQYVLLTVDVTKLEGTLIFEANRPGGDKYYHIYNGAIPMNAIKSFEVTSKKAA